MSAREFGGYACFVASAVFWLAAYVAILYRNSQDRSYGMPLAALGANLAWEFTIAFLYPPTPLFARLCVIAWFLLDLPVAAQCLKRARDEFTHPWAKKYAPAIFSAALAMGFVVVWGFIREFNDLRGWYSGFGINLLMSALFVAMLIRRDSLRGQSLYIAVFKLCGTLCAFLWSFFWTPANILTPMTEIVPPQSYPPSPLIVMLYTLILLLDVLYIVLLCRIGARDHINLWRRF